MPAKALSPALLAAIATVLIAGNCLGCGGGGDEGSNAPTGSESVASTAGAKGEGHEAEPEPFGEAQKSQPNGEAGGGDRERPTQKAGDAGDPTEHTDSDSGGGAAQFQVEGGDNSIQGFGEEASSSERSAAAAVLHEYLDAVVRGDWESACGDLSAEVASFDEVRGSRAVERGGCPVALPLYWPGRHQAGSPDVAEADVGSFRVQGARGYLLFYGPGNVPLQIPMAREGGDWKVDAVYGSAL